MVCTFNFFGVSITAFYVWRWSGTLTHFASHHSSDVHARVPHKLFSICMPCCVLSEATGYLKIIWLQPGYTISEITGKPRNPSWLKNINSSPATTHNSMSYGYESGSYHQSATITDLMVHKVAVDCFSPRRWLLLGIVIVLLPILSILDTY